MKTTRFIESLFVATCLMLSACGDKKITVKGVNGTEYESYQECCSAQDFQAAHNYLLKMQGNADTKDYDEAEDYVFNAELLYLSSLDIDNTKERILYLIKEFQILGKRPSDHAVYEKDDYDDVKRYIEGIERFNKRCNSVLDLAIAQGDHQWALKVIKIMEKNVDADVWDDEIITGDYIDTDINIAKEKIIDALNSGSLKDEEFESAKQRHDKAAIDNYINKNLSFSRKDILNYIASANIKEYDEKIIGKLTSEESSIEKKPQMGSVKTKKDDAWNFEKSCDRYIRSIDSFNSRCQELLGLAISNKNQHLAKRIVTKFKSNIRYEKSDVSFMVTADNNSIDEAKATYQEAVSSGAFK